MTSMSIYEISTFGCGACVHRVDQTVRSTSDPSAGVAPTGDSLTEEACRVPKRGSGR